MGHSLCATGAPTHEALTELVQILVAAPMAHVQYPNGARGLPPLLWATPVGNARCANDAAVEKKELEVDGSVWEARGSDVERAGTAFVAPTRAGCSEPRGDLIRDANHLHHRLDVVDADDVRAEEHRGGDGSGGPPHPVARWHVAEGGREK